MLVWTAVHPRDLVQPNTTRMSFERNQTVGLPNVTGMTALPIELIQMIADHGPISCLISLKLVARIFYSGLSSPPSGYIETASDCEKRATRRYVTERVHISGGRRKCIICDGLMPLKMYQNRTEPVCKWHLNWFERTHLLKELLPTHNVGVTATVKVTKTICGHCKEVRGFELGRCACESEDGCESCGNWEVECRVELVR
jgi:hypothetical protein